MTVENLYAHIENLSKTEEEDLKKFLKESLGINRPPLKALYDGKDSAFLSKTLATIKTDIEEVKCISIEDIKLQIDLEAKKKVLQELEIKSIE